MTLRATRTGSPWTRHANWIALGAGLISATGFAPLDWWPVTLAALVVLLRLVHDAPKLRTALLRGWLFGLGHFTVGNNWIQHAFTYQDAMPHWLGYLAVVLLALYLAVYPMLAAGLAWRFGRGRRPDTAYVLIFAAAWIVTEWLRASMFTGYAWNPLGMVWLPIRDIALLASDIGTYALSGFTVVVAGAIMLLPLRDWKLAAAAKLVIAILLVVGLVERQQPSTATALVRVVQPNISQDLQARPDFDELFVRTLIADSGRAGPTPRLIVWPEGAVNQYVEDGYPRLWYWKGAAPAIRARLAALLGPRDMLLFGGNALLFAPDGKTLKAATNSIYAIDYTARLHGRYDKAHLVPYGEYLPMRPILSAIGLSRLVAGDIDFQPGPGARTLDIPGFGKLGMQLCYEIIFSGQVIDRANRPELIFNPSNDAWFGAWGPPQHLAQARMRAIEEGVPVLRSTPNGISAIIDARGTLLATVPRHRAGAIEMPLPRPLPPTLFARAGNLLAFAVAALLLAGAIVIRRYRR